MSQRKSKKKKFNKNPRIDRINRTSLEILPTREQKTQLREWYLQNKRPLPWRLSKDPYQIWISEVMLQQTTTSAVIPYFNRFLEKFPTVQELAQADVTEVLELWSGLGYYSRARNLHKAAQELAKNFPKTHQELLNLPGFGPYTARAVSSLAFEESVGVLDGNVFRILSRLHNLKREWWRPQERNFYQNLADSWVHEEPSSVLNQAMMELGATICTPQNPSCLLCPLRTSCLAYKNKKVELLPLKKPRRTKEIWVWSAHLLVYKNRIGFVKNDYAPFLRGQPIFPGQVQKRKTPPAAFAYKHNITHHQIYVKTQVKKLRTLKKIPIKNIEWIALENIKKHHPLALLQKALSQHFS